MNIVGQVIKDVSGKAVKESEHKYELVLPTHNVNLIQKSIEELMLANKDTPSQPQRTISRGNAPEAVGSFLDNLTGQTKLFRKNKNNRDIKEHNFDSGFEIFSDGDGSLRETMNKTFGSTFSVGSSKRPKTKKQGSK